MKLIKNIKSFKIIYWAALALILVLGGFVWFRFSVKDPIAAIPQPSGGIVVLHFSDMAQTAENMHPGMRSLLNMAPVGPSDIVGELMPILRLSGESAVFLDMSSFMISFVPRTDRYDQLTELLNSKISKKDDEKDAWNVKLGQFNLWIKELSYFPTHIFAASSSYDAVSGMEQAYKNGTSLKITRLTGQGADYIFMKDKVMGHDAYAEIGWGGDDNRISISFDTNLLGLNTSASGDFKGKKIDFYGSGDLGLVFAADGNVIASIINKYPHLYSLTESVHLKEAMDGRIWAYESDGKANLCVESKNIKNILKELAGEDIPPPKGFAGARALPLQRIAAWKDSILYVLNGDSNTFGSLANIPKYMENLPAPLNKFDLIVDAKAIPAVLNELERVFPLAEYAEIGKKLIPDGTLAIQVRLISDTKGDVVFVTGQ